AGGGGAWGEWVERGCGRPIEKVLRGGAHRRLMKPTTALESIPPLKNAPSGTSLINLTLTASAINSRVVSTAVCSSSRALGVKGKSQYREVVMRPRSKVSVWAAGSFTMPLNIVLGLDTYPYTRYSSSAVR